MSTVPEVAPPEVERHRKPPFLRRVRIRNFKSIKFCDVTLEPLTVLVGRNGSGKNNFVEALAFLRDVIMVGVREAVKKHGDGGMLLCQLASGNRMSFSLETNLWAQRERELGWATYEVDIDLPARRVPRVALERLRIQVTPNVSEIGYTVENGQLVNETDNPQPGKHGQRYSRITHGIPAQPEKARKADRLRLSSLGETPFIEFVEGLESITGYNLHPDSMRMPQREQYGDFLASDGSNVASVLDITTECEPELTCPPKSGPAEVIVVG